MLLLEYEQTNEGTVVKQTNWLLILVVLGIGVALGLAYCRYKQLETQVASHNTRLQVLEEDHTNRTQLKVAAKTTWRVAAGCLRWLTFGLVKGA